MGVAHCILLTVLVAAPEALAVQEPDTVDVRTAIASLRAYDNVSAALALLTQERGPRPRAELDALADSLVAIASSYRATDPLAQRRMALSAVSTLGTAGGRSRSLPYAGALQALIRVYENAPDLRGGTLSAISRLPPTGPSIDFLAEVATTERSGGVTSAIHYLHTETGPAGLARLRRLYETDAIVDERGRHQIAAIAALQGWGGSVDDAQIILGAHIAAAVGPGAQEPDTVDVRSAIALLRAYGNPSEAVALLAQERGPRPQTELDALADSLVAIASSYRPTDPPAQRRMAQAARSALGSAGRASRSNPYAGALEALIRVHENAPDLGGGTLSAIAELPPTGPVIDFLAEVATTGRSGGVTDAIHYLHTKTGPAGLARLRRLYETNAIVDERGRHQIEAIAALQGWGG